MANFWSIQFSVILGIFAQIFFPATNFKALALTNIEGKEKCVGKYQLGVDNFNSILDSRLLIQFNDLDKIPTKSTIENNGRILKIELNYDGTVPTMEVNLPPFGVVGTFRLQFLYFQWFEKMLQSSNFNNVIFPTQLHAVFCDVTASSCNQAVALDNSIIVLAFHMRISNWESDNIGDLRTKLQYVQQPNTKIKLGKFNLNYWNNSIQDEYVAYEGSFLEFPCQGKVIWVDYKNDIQITTTTVSEFSKLKSYNRIPLIEQVSQFVKPKGKVFKKNTALDGAKKNHLAIPGLIFGLLFMIFCLF